MESERGAGGVVVAGVGGAGVNAVGRLAAHAAGRVRLLAVDTSWQSLGRAPGDRILLDGGTSGLGTGGDAELGRLAARSGREAVQVACRGADIVLVVAGLAGGTGGGAGPEVARLVRQAGAVVIGFGVEPFAFEGPRVRRRAADARRRLVDACDAYLAVDTAAAASLVGASLPLEAALCVADDVLRQAVEGLDALVRSAGWIQVGLAACRQALAHGGAACLAVGVGRGSAPALSAMRAALASPLSDMTLLAGARSAMVHVAGGDGLSIEDVADAVDLVRGRVPESCHVSVGCGGALLLRDTARVSVVAVTGGQGAAKEPGPAPARRPLGAETQLPSLDALLLGVPVRQAV